MATQSYNPPTTPSAGLTPRRAVLWIALPLFLLSGATGLIYEIVWAKLLSLEFGVSAYAITTVLMAYMGGLALGAWLLGRLADRMRRPLLWYGLIELFIGAYALLLPHLLGAIGRLHVLIWRTWQPGFVTESLLRLVLALLALLVPTTLMGGTLPILIASLTRHHERTGKRTAVLYGINTLGGVAGCLVAGFWLIPKIGMTGAVYVAAVINAAICLAAVIGDRAFASASAVPMSETPAAGLSQRERNMYIYPRHVARAAQVVIAVSGFTAMAYQHLWTRIISMVVGTTVYAFTTIVAAFLLGLVGGSLLYRLRPPLRPARFLIGAQIVIGGFVLLVSPRADRLPFVFLRLFEASRSSWPLFQLARFGLLTGIMLLPTMMFGLSFPLAAQISARRGSGVGRVVGKVTSWNTLGAVVGAFAGGFVFLPLLGMQQGLLVAATINILAAIGLAVVATSQPVRMRVTAVSAALVVLLIGVMLQRPWKLSYLNSAPYVYANRYNQLPTERRIRNVLEAFEILYYDEGPGATVAVTRSPVGTLSMTIDGKTDASTGPRADMSTQVLLSHLPAMFHPEPDRALMIGLGSGVSLGSLLQHPVRHVDCVELSPAVVEASRFFRAYNHCPLDDPRVELIVGDGRHHLLRTPKTYDLIISQPSNPWIAGVSDLFTREYYELMRRRVSEDGIVCQWIPSYQMSRRMLAVLFRTFRKEFPHCTLWTSTVVGDLFLIGSKRQLRLDFDVLRRRLGDEGIRHDLARIDMATPEMLVKTFRFGNEGLAAYVAKFDKTPQLNTDAHPVLEYMTPRFLLNERVARDFDRKMELIGRPGALLKLLEFDTPDQRDAFLGLLH